MTNIDKVEFYRILATTADDGHPHWPGKKPNEALVQLGEKVVGYLIEALESEYRPAAMMTLAGIGPTAIPAINDLIDQPPFRKTAMSILITLAHIHQPIKANIQHQSLIEFVGIDYKNIIPDFHELQKMEYEQADVISVLGLYHVVEAIPVLLEKLNDGNYLCGCACRALAKLKDPLTLGPLLEVLQDEEKFWVPRGAAAVAIGSFGSLAIGILPEIEKALQYKIKEGSENWDERAKSAVIDAIHKIKNPNHKSLLKGKGFKYEMWGIY